MCASSTAALIEASSATPRIVTTSAPYPLDSLRQVKSVISNSKVAVAGGIKPETIKDIVAEEPDLIIVGGGIANADDVLSSSSSIKR